ncbi:MAG: serine O-acetyltransferase [Lachnospiraceae bacterium]
MDIVNEEEINSLVEKILDDYSDGKIIDGINIYNKPDKVELRHLTNQLLQIVFPGYFKDKHYKIYNARNSFAVLIEDAFYHLKKQVYLALDFCRLRGTLTEKDREKESYQICKKFFETLPKVREYVETDIIAAYDGDPAAGCYEEIILAYPGIMASAVNRLAHELYLLNVPVLPRLMTEYAHTETGIDIHPGATLGKYFFIDHGTGVVIGGTAVIGNHVKIYQGVTLGALSTRGGQKLSGKKRHPTIEDNVTIYSGASVLGGETVVGKNAVIGGNAFITSSIPADTKVSIKNQELEYRGGEKKHKTEEIQQSNEWYYVI